MTTIKVRDARSNGRFCIDNIIVDRYGQILGPYGLALYMALVRHAHNDTQACYPHTKTLAKETGMSVRAVNKHLNRLCELGLVHRESGKPNGRGNTYTILDPPQNVHQTTPKEEACAPNAQGCAPDAQTSEGTNLTNESSGGEATPHLPDRAGRGWHPARMIHYRVTGTPKLKKAQVKLIEDTFGPSPSEQTLQFWEQVVTRWCEHGWSEYNVAGMIECFRSGSLPGGGKRPRGKVGRLHERRNGHEDRRPLWQRMDEDGLWDNWDAVRAMSMIAIGRGEPGYEQKQRALAMVLERDLGG